MYAVVPNNTGDTLKAQSPDSVRQMWQDGCDTFEETEDIFREFEGGQDSIIESRRDFAAGAGFKLHFTPRSGIYNKGRSGDQLFTDSSHFAKIDIGHDELVVDYLRNGWQYTARMEEIMGMRGEIVNGTNTIMGEWMGREECVRLAMTILHKVNSENFLIAGSRATVDDLKTADTLSVDEIITMNGVARARGGKPGIIAQDQHGNDIWGNWVIGTTAAVSHGLKLDQDYRDIQKYAGERGASNLLFRGGISDVDGNYVREWNDVDHDGAGAVGTPFNPKAYLGVPITAGTGTFDITGGGTLNTDGALTDPEWFRFFPKHAFEFIAGDTLSTTATTWDLHTVSSNQRFYVTIVNPRNTGAANDGKWNIYECNVNNGNKLSVVRRLASAAAGAAVDTLGGVTWSGTVNTDAHPTGSLIYLSTAKGIPYGYTPMLLKQALRRGRGIDRNKRGQNSEEDGFNTKCYIRSIFGQAPRKRRDGRIPGIVVLKHAITYKGWNIPVVT